MPRGNSAVYAATALFFVGLALAIAGLLSLSDRRFMGIALLAGGFAVVVTASLLSRRGQPSGGGDHPPRGA
jgi:hypothetical protein